MKNLTNKTIKMPKTGINIEQFKKYITKNFGEKCESYVWGCVVCRIWRLQEELESFMEEQYETNSRKKI